ncbi:hypothetical protein NK553_18225 [Pseudomonas sp. ZM23]|uniref:Transmembrane protein n=1 Tax=Pseudomonas triclosanedens TaxID=2961893 RepID=A0ABY6ZRC1_9PSED|nr:hypothetical protein [Pseudomonas triclosanedens]MCP8465891.1 hypothetical protein [Pseudomonas triclosanedens]MCP8472212.1 hypothetical protein [Pseudomonas triclosanedens]MCP8477190.1 hypothetical protein [Pseudomonas triclosanedens]WAI47472.1 hypothetical protein OU419_16990 [Pseudomonas triclosanedens]
MGVVTLEGVIEEVGGGHNVDGEANHYEFIKIGGKRIRSVSCDNYLGSFLRVGKNVRLSLAKGMFTGHYLYAVQLVEDGEVLVTSKAKIFAGWFVYAFIWGCVLVIPAAIYGGYSSNGIGAGLLWAFGSTFLAYMGVRDGLKARKVFGVGLA